MIHACRTKWVLLEIIICLSSAGIICAAEIVDRAEVTCSGEQLGTAITWYKDSNDAAKLAREQDKLVMLIQVSGNFAREEFT